MKPKTQNQTLRNELKYILSRGEYAALTQRCRTVMKRDPHAGKDGTYRITSLYFDDLGDTALLQNYSGVSRREKFRIRYYSDDFSTLHLEKKVKYGGLGTKYSCPMTEEQLRKLLEGDYSWMMDTGHPLMQELYLRMTTDILRPKTIVSYTREPFVYGPGNVRVTFDYDIRSSVRVTDMLKSDALVPAAVGQVLMEVKYDDFLPDIIRMILQEGTLRARAFSKYAICRQYDI